MNSQSTQETIQATEQLFAQLNLNKEFEENLPFINFNDEPVEVHEEEEVVEINAATHNPVDPTMAQKDHGRTHPINQSRLHLERRSKRSRRLYQR